MFWIKKKKKTLYVHMGAPKTGSSFLQSLLMSNRKLLRDQGFVYPRCGLMNEQGTAQHFISFYLEGGKPDWVHRKMFTLEQLKNELKVDRVNNNNVIISSESFFGIPQSEHAFKLREIFPEHNIKFILYLRRPTSFAKSWYSQIVKEPGYFTKDFDHFAQNFSYHFDQIVSNYVSEFGIENMSVFSYESVLSEYPLENHFAKVTGFEIGPNFKYISNENVSPDASDIALFRKLNEYGAGLIPNDVRRSLYLELSELSGAPSDEVIKKLDEVGRSIISLDVRNEMYEVIRNHQYAEYPERVVFSPEAFSTIGDKYNSSFNEIINEYS